MGQVRVGPNGSVFGIDQASVSEIARTRGMTSAEVFELFQEAEIEFVKNFNTKES